MRKKIYFITALLILFISMPILAQSNEPSKTGNSAIPSEEEAKKAEKEAQAEAKKQKKAEDKKKKEEAKKAKEDKKKEAKKEKEPDEDEAGDDEMQEAPPVLHKKYDQNLYMRGDIVAQLKVGAYFPAMIIGLDYKNKSPMNLDIGINLGLALDAYMNNNVKLGGEIGFSTSKGLNDGQMYFIPILFRATYEFHVYSWSFPLGVSTGINILSYKGNMTSVNPVIRPEIGFIYKINQKWGVGFNVSWTITAEFVWDEIEKSRVGHTVEVGLVGQYYF